MINFDVNVFGAIMTFLVVFEGTMHDWLSRMSGIGCNWGNPRSFINYVNHMTFFVVKVATMYSACVEERAIVTYFLHCHEIAPPTSKNMYLDVNLLKSWCPT